MSKTIYLRTKYLRVVAVHLDGQQTVSNKQDDKIPLHCEYLFKNDIKLHEIDGIVQLFLRKMNHEKRTFFCRNLIANFKRFRCIRSPCSNSGPDKLVGS